MSEETLEDKIAGKAYVMGWKGCTALLRMLGFDEAADAVKLDD